MQQTASPQNTLDIEGAFAEVLRRARVLDWIYGVIGAFCAVAIATLVLRPQSFVVPGLGVGLAAAFLVLSLILPRMAFGRSVTGLACFFLLIHTAVIGLAQVNGLGLRTPTLSIFPIFLFLTACLAPWRLSLGLSLVTALMLLSLIPATPETTGRGTPTAYAEAQSALLNCVLVSLLGTAVGRLMRESIAESISAARTQYRSFYSEQSFDTLQAVLQASPYIIVILELSSGRIRLFNAAFAQALGRSVEEVERYVGPGLGGWADPDQRDAIMRRVQAGEVVEDHFAIRRADGTVRTVQGSAKPIHVDGVPHVLLVGHDVSDEARRQAELQAVIDTAEVALLVVRRGVIQLASRRYEQLLGYGAGEASGQPAEHDVGGAEVANALYEHHGPALRRGEVASFDCVAHCRDGRTFEARFTGRLISPGADDGFTTVFMIEDITEANRFRQQLEKSREDAMAASRAKSEFLATMSHEIRTPLNGVLGLAELAVDPKMDHDVRIEHLRMILESGRSLARTLSDVLDLSKIEAGRLELQPVPFDLGPWLENIRSSFIWSMESRGLRFVVSAPPSSLGWVHADPVRLRQILVNYLSNAQKFTFQGQITVSIERPTPNRLRLEVRDTGMGLDHSAQAKLFQPFEQTTLGARQMEATGLGLSICRELARRMGGEVGVLSTPGWGSTFWAEVQVAPTQAPMPQEASATSSTRPLEGLRVLLADDNRVNKVVGMRLLERAGAEVQTADDGAQALNAVQRSLEEGHGFDVILMDVQMPVMDGLEATRQIRRLSAGQGILIVACTAAALQDDLDEALAQGMDTAITKPFDTTRLVSAILAGLQEKKRRAHPVF